MPTHKRCITAHAPTGVPEPVAVESSSAEVDETLAAIRLFTDETPPKYAVPPTEAYAPRGDHG